MDKLKNALSSDSVKAQFQNALKDKSDLFVASIIDLYGTDSALQQCDPNSVIMEALKAAVLNLPINKSLGFSYIIAYNNNIRQQDGTWVKKMVPTFQMGYKGYIQLAMRTGQYRIINADMIYEGEIRTKNKLTGEYDLSGTAISEKVVGYFAHIEMLNGFSKTLYMTKDQVTNHAKRYSKSFDGKSSPWQTNFDEMAIKTVLRNLLSHYGFLSVEMTTAMSKDIEAESVEDQVAVVVEEKANKQKLSFDEAEVVEETAQAPGPGF